MAEWSKALRSGRSPILWAWVRIPLLTKSFVPHKTVIVIVKCSPNVGLEPMTLRLRVSTELAGQE